MSNRSSVRDNLKTRTKKTSILRLSQATRTKTSTPSMTITRILARMLPFLLKTLIGLNK